MPDAPSGQSLYDAFAAAQAAGYKGSLHEFIYRGGAAEWANKMEDKTQQSALIQDLIDLGLQVEYDENTGQASVTGIKNPDGTVSPLPESDSDLINTPGVREQLNRMGFDYEKIKSDIESGGNTSNVNVTNQTAGYETDDTTTDVTQGTKTDITQNSSYREGETTTETGVKDTLGLGGALQKVIPQATDAANSRYSYLQGLVNGSDQAQTDANTRNAINQSLSGPGMQGAGRGAQGRAAGYAAQLSAQQATANKLAASEQIAQGSGLEGLVQSGQGLLGRTQTTTAREGSTGEQTVQSFMEQARQVWNNTVGSASATNSGVAYGDTPMQEGGGKLVCAALVKQGLMDAEMFEDEKKYIRANIQKFRFSALGYMCVAVPFALATLHSISFAQVIAPYANGCSRIAAHKCYPARWKVGIFNWLCYGSFRFVFGTVGLFAKLFGYMPRVRNPEIRKLMIEYDDFITFE